MDSIKIARDRPLAGYRLIQALNSGPKISILRALINYPEGLTAKEIARLLGVKLPTAMEHLSDLIKTGIVRVKYEGRHKKYVLLAKNIVVEVNLPLYVSLLEKKEEAELYELEVMAIEYLKTKISSGGLPMNITVKDVARTIGVDTATAISIVDFINTYPDRFIHAVEQIILEELRRSKGPKKIADISRSTKIHKYWVILAVQNLVSKSLAKLEGDQVILIS